MLKTLDAFAVGEHGVVKTVVGEGKIKRRLFDISVASKMYGSKTPQSIINTSQKVYNEGVYLLRQECNASYKKLKNPKISQQQFFENRLTDFNNHAKKYMGDKIKLVKK